MQILKKTDKNIFIFLGLAIIILWQMLLPGYILTLDMVFTPKIRMFLNDGIFYNNLPLKYILEFLNLFVTGWVVEKILLIILFFIMGYLAFKFLPVPKKYFANYWASLFYVVNPFVYERFLAGHWTHLFACAFLPPFIHYLLKFVQEPEIRTSLWLSFWTFIIGVFSIQFFAMAVLIFFLYIFYALIKQIVSRNKEYSKKILKQGIIFGFLLLSLSSYWLVPYFVNNGRTVAQIFTAGHLDAFKTAGHTRIGASLNVLSLYGFWGERELWANYFLWPRDNFIFWLVWAVLLAVIITLGLFSGIKDKNNRDKIIFFFLLGTAAFVLSCGAGETVFKTFNFWLFRHLSFWSGFRDTNKFSGLLALSYAFSGSIGIAAIMEFLEARKIKFAKQALMFLFFIPIFYTYTIFGGFARQLRPVWYPQSWYRANEILNQDSSDFKALFLPWHQYLSLNFNRNIITANPAKAFFDKEIIQGENMELGKIFSCNNEKENEEMEELIINNSMPVDNILKAFVKKRIKYIVFSYDLREKDVFGYDFLNSKNLQIIYKEKELTLYKIVL